MIKVEEKLDLVPVIREKLVDKPGKPSLRTDDPNHKGIDKNAKELLYGYDNMARSIQDFMYVGRPKRSPKKEHTVEEYQEFMEKLIKRCWDNYNKGVKDLGGF